MYSQAGRSRPPPFDSKKISSVTSMQFNILYSIISKKELDNESKIRAFLKYSPDLIEETSGASMLEHACLHKNEEAITFLLQNEADMTKTNSKGISPLMLCTVLFPDAKILRLFMTKIHLSKAPFSADDKVIDKIDKDGSITRACASGYLAMVAKHVASQFFDVNVNLLVNNFPEEFQLHFLNENLTKKIRGMYQTHDLVIAIQKLYEELDQYFLACVHHDAPNHAKFFLELKPELVGLINQKNSEGDTPLHLAIKLAHLQMVKMLLEYDTLNINAQNDKGETPLYLACIRNHIEIVTVILEKNPDIEITPNAGEDILTIAEKQSAQMYSQLFDYMMKQDDIPVDLNDTQNIGKDIFPTLYRQNEQIREIICPPRDQKDTEDKKKTTLKQNSFIYTSDPTTPKIRKKQNKKISDNNNASCEKFNKQTEKTKIPSRETGWTAEPSTQKNYKSEYPITFFQNQDEDNNNKQDTSDKNEIINPVTSDKEILFCNGTFSTIKHSSIKPIAHDSSKNCYSYIDKKALEACPLHLKEKFVEQSMHFGRKRKKPGIKKEPFRNILVSANINGTLYENLKLKYEIKIMGSPCRILGFKIGGLYIFCHYEESHDENQIRRLNGAHFDIKAPEPDVMPLQTIEPNVNTVFKR